MGQARCGPLACQHGEAERLLPVAPALDEGPACAQGQRQVRLGREPHVRHECARLPVSSLHVPPQQLGRLAEVADASVDPPQV